MLFFMLLVRLLDSSRLLVVKFVESSKHGYLTVLGVGTPNIHIAQGSVVCCFSSSHFMVIELEPSSL